MNEIMGPKDAQRASFDEKFLNRDRVNNPIGLGDVLAVAHEEGILVDEPSVIVEQLKTTIINYAIMKMNEDYTDDIEGYIKSTVTRFLADFDEFFNEASSVYSAFTYLFEHEPFEAFEHISREMKTAREKLKKELGDFKEETMYLCEHSAAPFSPVKSSVDEISSGNWKSLFNDLDSNLRGIATPIQYIFLKDDMAPSGPNNGPHRMAGIRKFLEAAKLEASIIGKFDRDEVITVLDTMHDTTDYDEKYMQKSEEKELGIDSYDDNSDLDFIIKGSNISKATDSIARICLFNYVFNCLYRTDATILFSLDMAKTIAHDISMNMIDIEEIKDIIKNGPIKFDKEEEELILDRFISNFQYVIIEKHIKDNYVITNKKSKIKKK